MQVEGDFFDAAQADADKFLASVRNSIVDLVTVDTPFRAFLENAVAAAVYRPGLTLEEVAYREGYRTLAQQLLMIGQGGPHE